MASFLNGIFKEVVSRITPKGVETFESILDNPDQLDLFFSQRYEARAFLRALSLTEPESNKTLITRALCQKRALEHLTSKMFGEDVMDIVQTLPLEQQAQVLCAYDNVSLLTYCGQGKKVIDIIKSVPQEQQARILCADGAVGALTDRGYRSQIKEIQAGWDLSLQTYPDDMSAPVGP